MERETKQMDKNEMDWKVGFCFVFRTWKKWIKQVINETSGMKQQWAAVIGRRGDEEEVMRETLN